MPMKLPVKSPIKSIVALLFFAIPAFAKPLSVILVDKAKHQLHTAEYDTDKIEIKKSCHVTLGKKLGDKVVEKDLKTPEGIYFFRAKLFPPGLKKKFGVMALMMDYPNTIDKKAGKTGYDIMLHATDDPSRLKLDYDSEGCVVISNEDLLEVSKSIRLGVTPIIVYDEMKPEYLQITENTGVKSAFEKWMKAWEGKDIDNYIDAYAASFSYNGMNVKRYREYKDQLNKKYETITVNPQNIRYFQHPKYNVVMFTQNYESTLKGGQKGFKSSGSKLLYFVKDGDRYKIASEEYTTLKE